MDIQQTYQDFFTQYGQPSEEANKELRIWLRRPDTLDKIEDVTKSDEYAAEYIKKLEEYMAILKYTGRNYASNITSLPPQQQHLA